MPFVFVCHAYRITFGSGLPSRRMRPVRIIRSPGSLAPAMSAVAVRFGGASLTPHHSHEDSCKSRNAIHVSMDSVCVFVLEAVDNCQKQNLEVEHERPVLDVVEVVLDAHTDRRVAAPSVNLRPSRHSGANLVAEHVVR